MQLNHRSTLMAEELALPSLSGLPVKLGINMTSLLSLHLKGRVNYRDYSHFSLNGYIKPKYLNVTKCHMGSSFFTVWFFWGFFGVSGETYLFVLSAYVSLSARMGVDGALGQAAVEWVAELRSSTNLDGSIQLQEGQDFRVTLNTPEDLMDIFSLRYTLKNFH